MTQAPESRRTRLVRPYPNYTLRDALSVPRAIYEVNAGLAFEREMLASALGTTPKSSAFTMRLNASAAYGLTEGGYNDADIHLTDLGETIVASRQEPERTNAMIAAATAPNIFRSFYELFEGRGLPANEYLENILRRDLGVQSELTQECLAILLDNGEFAGIVSETDGQYVVSLPIPPVLDPINSRAASQQPRLASEPPPAYLTDTDHQAAALRSASSASTENRIFVGSVGDSEAADRIISMLGEFSIRCVSPQPTDAQAGPLVSQEVSAAMRDCASAVLVLGREVRTDGVYRMMGMLGAASALFLGRIVLICENGANLDIGASGLEQVEIDTELPGESMLNIFVALHNAGVIRVAAV